MIEISKHAQERYAERIMGRSEVVEVNRFIAEHSDKIKEDIGKMIEYSTEIYVGPRKEDKKEAQYRNNIIRIVVSGSWVIFIDTNRNQVVTLYKVDLGAGEEFNKQYMELMKSQIAILREELEESKKHTDDKNKEYQNMIDELNNSINCKKNQITNMQNLVTSYEDVIKNNKVEIQQAEDNLNSFINKLIGKRQF